MQTNRNQNGQFARQDGTSGKGQEPTVTGGLGDIWKSLMNAFWQYKLVSIPLALVILFWGLDAYFLPLKKGVESVPIIGNVFSNSDEMLDSWVGVDGGTPQYLLRHLKLDKFPDIANSIKDSDLVCMRDEQTIQELPTQGADATSCTPAIAKRQVKTLLKVAKSMSKKAWPNGINDDEVQTENTAAAPTEYTQYEPTSTPKGDINTCENFQFLTKGQDGCESDHGCINIDTKIKTGGQYLCDDDAGVPADVKSSTQIDDNYMLKLKPTDIIDRDEIEGFSANWKSNADDTEPRKPFFPGGEWCINKLQAYFTDDAIRKNCIKQLRSVETLSRYSSEDLAKCYQQACRVSLTGLRQGNRILNALTADELNAISELVDILPNPYQMNGRLQDCLLLPDNETTCVGDSCDTRYYSDYQNADLFGRGQTHAAPQKRVKTATGIFRCLFLLENVQHYSKEARRAKFTTEETSKSWKDGKRALKKIVDFVFSV